jgi:fluoride ion exporter CrcB/FEX
VLVAIFGYLFGFMLAISGFQFGRQVAALMYSWKHRDDSETAADEEIVSDEQELICRSFCRPKLLILVPAFIFIALFVVGDVVHEIQFYRNMTLMWLLAPFGASIRWKLSKWNSPNNRSFCLVRLNWVPVGTLAANLVGAICSIVCTGLLDRANYEEQTLDPWVLAILFAVKTGFAGSLSTVSSLVKEVVFLSDEHPAQIKSHMYAFITCVCAIATGLIIYAPIARTT